MVRPVLVLILILAAIATWIFIDNTILLLVVARSDWSRLCGSCCGRS